MTKYKSLSPPVNLVTWKIKEWELPLWSPAISMKSGCKIG